MVTYPSVLHNRYSLAHSIHMQYSAYLDLSSQPVISNTLGIVQCNQGSLQSLLKPHLMQTSLHCISISSSSQRGHVSIPDRKSVSLLLGLPVPQLDTSDIDYSPTNVSML